MGSQAAVSFSRRLFLGAMLWKNQLQARRLFHLPVIFSWMLVFAAALALGFLPDWGARICAVVGWVLLMGQRTTTRLRRDLSIWWLVRQVPVSSEQFILLEVAGPVLPVVLLSVVALGFGQGLSTDARLLAVLLIPGVAVCTALGAAGDILRQATASLLLAGTPPSESALGALIGLLGILLPVASVYLMQAVGIPFWGATLLAVLVTLVLAYGLVGWYGATLRRIE
jgi:hypothetical protein